MIKQNINDHNNMRRTHLIGRASGDLSLSMVKIKLYSLATFLDLKT